MESAALVYQVGIANVFNTTNEARIRSMQHTFSSCEWFARGLEASGVLVEVYGCNKAGDITHEQWTEDLQSLPFSDHFNFKEGGYRQ